MTCLHLEKREGLPVVTFWPAMSETQSLKSMGVLPSLVYTMWEGPARWIERGAYAKTAPYLHMVSLSGFAKRM